MFKTIVLAQDGSDCRAAGRSSRSRIVGALDRKRWWRNLCGGGRVRLRLRGSERSGHACVRIGAEGEVIVDLDLDPSGAA